LKVQSAKLRAQNINAKIIYNQRIAESFYKIGLVAPSIAKNALPGQFIMVRCAHGCQPLLRRPFSIHRVSGLAGERVSELNNASIIEILYEIVGDATQILSQKKPGEFLDIIGPLGNGFALNPHTRTPAHSLTRTPVHPLTLLVAGGIGVAPLLFLAERLKVKCSTYAKVSGDRQRSQVLIGAKTKREILCEKEFKALGCDVRIATDDGSVGHKGFATDLLESVIMSIFACGPHLMLQEIARIAKQHNIPAQVSLEAHMACGIGACLGCVVETKDGYKRVCKDGPVFDATKIIWG
jgi:dihydroorotate dehydrogenase electron transfer subunit